MENAVEVFVSTDDYEVFDVLVKKFKTKEEVESLCKRNLNLDQAWEYADGLCEEVYVVGVFEGDWFPNIITILTGNKF